MYLNLLVTSFLDKFVITSIELHYICCVFICSDSVDRVDLTQDTCLAKSVHDPGATPRLDFWLIYFTIF